MVEAKRLVVHVADIQVSETSGMGRIAWHWKQELERRGYDYLHIGPQEVGSLLHSGLFPYAAFRAYRRLKREATFFLVHEAASSWFLERRSPVAVFSHGLDRRSWELGKQRGQALSLKSRLLFPLWRIRPCDLGIRKANTLLFSNYEDVEFAQQYYHRSARDIMVFRNGIYPSDLDETQQPGDRPTIGFLATWSERKGMYTLMAAAEQLHSRGHRLHWLLAGTGGSVESVQAMWPADLQPFVEVMPKFQREEESAILARCNVFVLPSFYEGQPLSLLQAMAAGRCCITTNCCGQRDVIRHGDNGLLHEPGDADRLAQLIEQVITQPEQRLALGRRARESVGDRPWEQVSREVVDRLEQVFGLERV
ncbi:MAG: glycosyltransferase family 4 protein [Synechococcales bacterium]|nr:glycosyltransferase family 4 protein [Synechococcales bacterium]